MKKLLLKTIWEKKIPFHYTLTNDIDVTNNEAVMKGDNSIGYITSGGFAHFVNKSVAFSYIDQKHLSSEDGIQVEINGDLFNCSIIKEPLYDPSGEKMRG